MFLPLQLRFTLSPCNKLSSSQPIIPVSYLTWLLRVRGVSAVEVLIGTRGLFPAVIWLQPCGTGADGCSNLLPCVAISAFMTAAIAALVVFDVHNRSWLLLLVFVLRWPYAVDVTLQSRTIQLPLVCVPAVCALVRLCVSGDEGSFDKASLLLLILFFSFLLRVGWGWRDAGQP